MKQRQKLTLKLGSLVKETLVKNNKRAGRAYKWTKVGNQAGRAQFHVPLEIDGRSVVAEVVGLVVVIVWWWWWCRSLCGGHGAGHGAGGGGRGCCCHGRRHCHPWWWALGVG